MSSVTFGSVGDIIAVCLLAKDIVKALDDSRGSSAEYQGLVTEIRSLESSLLEVELFIRSWRDASTFNSLERECSKLVCECRKTLEEFQSYLKKYESSLSKDSHVGILRRARTKLKWHLDSKDTVSRFRSELAGHSNALNMMMITANVMISLKGFAKQKESASSSERVLAAQDATLDSLRSEIRNNSALASSMTSMIRVMHHQFSWFTNLLLSVKSMLNRGFKLNLATYRAVLSIQESLSHSMDRTLIQDPFVLEDPLGRVTPVHLQFITSWQAFQAVLVTRFEGLPGHDKIERREFVLQERATSREISHNESWEIALRPGALVCMSLVFQREVKTEDSQSHCPYCGNVSEKQTTDDVHCVKCNMIYRRITEVTEVDPPRIPGLPKHWSQKPSFGRTGFNDQPQNFDERPQNFGPFLKRKRTMESWEELSLSEQVRNFKRVRVLSNVKKARRTGFVSWEDKTSWETTESQRIDTTARQDSLEANTTSSVGLDSSSSSFPIESAILSGASFYSQTKGKLLKKTILRNTLDGEDDAVSDSAEDKDAEGQVPDSSHHPAQRPKDGRSDCPSSEGHVPGFGCYPLPRVVCNPPRPATRSYWPPETVTPCPKSSRLELPRYEPHFRLLQDPKSSYSQGPHISDRCWIRLMHLLLRVRYANGLNGKRAHLLRYLPGGPILAPIVSDSHCQILDIGPPDAWPLIAIQYMPKANILNVQQRHNQTSRDIISQLEMHAAGKFDLIHLQDWTVAANPLPNFIWDFLREVDRILKPGGWIEMEILQLRMECNSCVQLQNFPFVIEQALSSIGMKHLDTAKGIAELLHESPFTNVQSTAHRIPVTHPSNHYNGDVLGGCLRELLLELLDLVQKLAGMSGEPLRPFELAELAGIRFALSFGGIDPMDFMNLVRIRAQKPMDADADVARQNLELLVS